MRPGPFSLPAKAKARYVAVLFSCLVILSFVLAACGPSTTQKTSVLSYGYPGGNLVQNFNPFLVNFTASPQSLIYERLLYINRLSGAVNPWLASSYQFSSDASSITFHLGPNVQWSDGQPFTSADVVFTSVTATEGGEIYALGSDFRMPQHVVRVSSGKAGYDVTPLWPDFKLAHDRERIERSYAVAPDGSRVPYWLLTPAGATSTNPAPLVVFANAYVPFSWINQWYFRWNATAYTSQGYAVVLPDPAPSLGYGETFLQRGWGRWLETSLPDFLAAIDSAAQRPDIDGSRIALVGGGWGGYLASLAATRSDRFSCIVVQGGCWDLPSYQGTTDEYDRWEEQLGDPYRNGERYLQLSPSTAVGSVKAPFLIFSGGIDYRAPSSDAIRMFRDLRRHGVDAKLVFMPEEGHRIGRLENERLWYETIFAYLDHHLRGRPWIPPRIL